MFLNLFCSLGQNEYCKTYKFEAFTVESDTCQNNTSIRILEKNKSIYYKCGGEGMGYYNIDTLTVNADSLPDFIYCYQMEDYTIVELLVSSPDIPYYKYLNVIDVSSPEIYGDFTLAKGETLKDYILKDVDKDGKRDLLTNMVEKNKSFHPIKNFTDTIPYKELKERAEGKITKPQSRGVLLSH